MDDSYRFSATETGWFGILAGNDCSHKFPRSFRFYKILQEKNPKFSYLFFEGLL